MFQSDFYVIADYFRQVRSNNKGYIPSTKKFEHTDAVLKYLGVFTSDERFSDLSDDSGKEVMNMCEVLDRVEKKGIQIGRAEGKLEGRLEKGIRVFQNMIKRGFPESEAQAIAELTDEEVLLAKKGENNCRSQ